MPNLYPTINLPTLITPQSSTVTVRGVAPDFDFDSGEFLFDSAGRIIIADSDATFEQWAQKICMTERGTRLAYGDKIGVEFESAMKEPDPEAVKSSIIRTITESLMIHPRTEYVKNFTFSGAGDGLKVSFDVKPRN